MWSYSIKPKLWDCVNTDISCATEGSHAPLHACPACCRKCTQRSGKPAVAVPPAAAGAAVFGSGVSPGTPGQLAEAEV